MNMDEALQVFIAESQELLQQMEEALLQMENDPDNADTINAIFRAAHTIKGSAGLFGLEPIIALTHIAESVLDRVRSGELRFDAGLTALLLQVGDHLGELVRLVDEGQDLPPLPAEVRPQHEHLSECLSRYLPATAVNPSLLRAPERINRGSEEGLSADHWHLSLRFGAETLRNGMDPLGLFRYLNTFGRIVNIVPVLDHMPAAAQMDPETCYLGFEVAFYSDADKSTIDGAFEFVREDSLIRILPPHSRSEQYLELIRALPEEDMRLGEILIGCGTLTAAELQEVLHSQVQQPRAETRPIGQVLMEQNRVQPPVIAAALQKQQQIKDKRSNENTLIRVDAGKLDRLIDLVGELIIAGAAAQMTAQRCGHSEMQEATEALSRLVEAVRDAALPLRMVQIGSTFNRFQRVVHDVSRDLGKDIALSISGGETELDKTVIERITDPLTHLVRNAMDHGIEPVETRLAQGKPAQGRVWLNALHDAGSILIEVGDDGGGLDVRRIQDKARKRGLLSEGQQLTEKDLFNLIFEPGFSTAEQVSNLSGRGVGMDVVKRNIAALRGTIELDSTPGQGTRVRISLPLTLAIIDGFLVSAGQASYVIPLELVEECIELSDDGVLQRGHLELRGQMLPVMGLRELFQEGGPRPRRESVVVVRRGGLRAGLVVDQLLGEFQAVIKPLGKVFAACPGLGGFTILGDGSVALILDIPNLLSQFARLPENPPHARIEA